MSPENSALVIEGVYNLHPWRSITDEESRLVCKLTVTEEKYVRLFIDNPGQVFSIREIVQGVYQQNYMDDDKSRVFVVICNIRKKLAETTLRDKIVTVTKVGYAWDEVTGRNT